MAHIDLKKLCEDSHRISAEKGWLEGEKRPFAAICDLIHSELSEALEDYRDNRAVDEIYYEVSYSLVESHDNGTGSASGGQAVKMDQARLDDLKARGADIRSAKPCGIPIEFADVVIRIAQHCGTEGWDLAGAVEYKNSLTRRLGWGDFEEALAYMHLFTSRAFAFTKGFDFGGVAGMSVSNTTNHALNELANAYLVIYDFCMYPVGNGKPRIDLAAAVALKQAYNETRPHRHGGKKI